MSAISEISGIPTATLLSPSFRNDLSALALSPNMVMFSIETYLKP